MIKFLSLFLLSFALSMLVMWLGGTDFVRGPELAHAVVHRALVCGFGSAIVALFWYITSG